MRCVQCRYPSPPGVLTCDNCGEPLGVPIAEGPRPPSVLPVSLSGRGVELAQLEALFDEAVTTGRPVTALLLGPAGIGKQRLTTELVRVVRSGNRARVCRGYDDDDEAPSAPHTLFRSLLRNRYRLRDRAPLEPQLAALREEVGAVYGNESEQVLRMLGSLADLPGLAPPRAEKTDEVEGSEGFSFTALRYYLEREASLEPLLITLEGLESAGSEDLELFHYLAGSLCQGPLLLLATSSPALLATAPLHKLQAAGVRVIELAPLGVENTGSLLGQLLEGVAGVPDDLSTVAQAQSGGYPESILQFVRSLLARGVIHSEGGSWQFDEAAFRPDEFGARQSELGQARLDHLTTEDRLVLSRAAVMGPTFWIEGLALLARSTSRREGSRDLWRSTPWLERVRARVTAMVERGLLMPAEDPRLPGEEAYSFFDPEEQARLYQALGVDEARRMHALLAQWLEHTRPARPAVSRLVLQAKHLQSAGLPDEAAACYLMAGRVAAAGHERQRAEELLGRALKLRRSDDGLFAVEVLHDLGDLATLAGDVNQAMGYFNAMLEWAWLLDHRRKGGAAHNRIGRLLRKQGNLDRAVDSLMTAWGLFECAGDDQGVASCLDDIGQIHWLRGHQEEALDHYRRALELRRSLGETRGVALSLHNIGTVLAERGQYEQALDALTEALELRKSLGQLNDVIPSLTTIGQLYNDLGDQERAGEIWQEALTLVHETGDRQREALLLVYLGQLRLERGDPLRAKTYLDLALALGRKLGDPVVLVEGQRILAEATALLHAPQEAQALADQALAMAREMGNPLFQAAVLRTRAEIARQGGEPQLARSLLEQAAGLLTDGGSPVQLGLVLQALGQVLEELGLPVEAALARESFGNLEAAIQAARALTPTFGALSPPTPCPVGRLPESETEETLLVFGPESQVDPRR